MQNFWDYYKKTADYYKQAAAEKNTPKITQAVIDQAKEAFSNVPFNGADQYLTDRENAIRAIAEKNNVRMDELMSAVRKQVGEQSVGKGGMVSGIKAREKMLASGELAGKEAQAAKSFIADTEKYLFPSKINNLGAEVIQTQEQRVPGLGKVIGPAIGVAQAGLAAQDIIDKVKAGQSVEEAVSNPEVVKNAARGALGYMGADVGANLGSLVPGGVAAKFGGELAGAVAGGYAGAKLADLLTGNPVVDKIIRAQYEKARNERMAKTKPTAASSVGLRQGE